MHKLNRSPLTISLFLGMLLPSGCDPADEVQMLDEVEVLATQNAESAEVAARPAEDPEDGEYTQDPALIQEFDLAANLTPANGPDGKTCCAKCNSHQAYHALWGIEYNCNFYADYWCAQYNRGGLQNAAWLYVPSQCQP